MGLMQGAANKSRQCKREELPTSRRKADCSNLWIGRVLEDNPGMVMPEFGTYFGDMIHQLHFWMDRQLQAGSISRSSYYNGGCSGGSL